MPPYCWLLAIWVALDLSAALPKSMLSAGGEWTASSASAAASAATATRIIASTPDTAAAVSLATRASYSSQNDLARRRCCCFKCCVSSGLLPILEAVLAAMGHVATLGRALTYFILLIAILRHF